MLTSRTILALLVFNLHALAADVLADTSVELDGERDGAEADELGPIGGGSGYARIVTEGDLVAASLDQLLEALAEGHPEEAAFREDLAAAEASYGRLFEPEGKHEEAVAAFRRSIELTDGLLQHRPREVAFVMTQISTCVSLASVLETLGDMEGRKKILDRARELSERVDEEDRNKVPQIIISP